MGERRSVTFRPDAYYFFFFNICFLIPVFKSLSRRKSPHITPKLDEHLTFLKKLTCFCDIQERFHRCGHRGSFLMQQ